MYLPLLIISESTFRKKENERDRKRQNNESMCGQVEAQFKKVETIS